MLDLVGELTRACAAAFAAEGLDPALGAVQRSGRPDLSPFQCNGAMPAAKSAGKPPRAIAEAVAARLAGHELIAKIEIAGPGFINLDVTEAALAAAAERMLASPLAGALPVAAPRRVIVDYGGPNVAKAMHVGHLRSAIIGEALKRLFRFRGDAVWGDAHFGDWGFQMGLLIVALEDELGGFASPDALDQRLSALTLDDLAGLYAPSAKRAKEDSAFRDRARKATAALQAGEANARRIWEAMKAVSMAALKRDYAALQVDFDLWLGEADADPIIPEMVEDLRAKHLLVEDQGAQVVHVAGGETRKKKLDDGSVIEAPYPPPLLVISSEGSAMYGTTDLATILLRRRDYDPDLFLYVVDQRQSEHFEQVFRAAALAGYAPREALEHIGFGTMNGPDGKPFKTRSGDVVRLSDLIGDARTRARKRLEEAELGADFPPAEFDDVADKVGVAAIKFADLMNFRGTSYVFDLDRFTAFEGKTGPYLLYACVRIKSILRKAAEQDFAAGAMVIEAPAERGLALALDAFAGACDSAYEKRAPHFLAEHAFALAQAWSAFYSQCPVLAAPEAALRASRLALAQATLKQLETTLYLLGISAPERM